MHIAGDAYVQLLQVITSSQGYCKDIDTFKKANTRS